MLAVDAFPMGYTDIRSARSALDRDPKIVDKAVSLMRRCHDHEKELSVERRLWTLALEEGDPVAQQMNRVQDERSGSLDVGELNENIEKLAKLLANINMAGPWRRMSPVKCFSCGETGHIARYCRSNVQRPYHRTRNGVYVKAAQEKISLRAACEQPVAVKLDKESGRESISTQKVPQLGLIKLDWLTTVIFFSKFSE